MGGRLASSGRALTDRGPSPPGRLVRFYTYDGQTCAQLATSTPGRRFSGMDVFDDHRHVHEMLVTVANSPFSWIGEPTGGRSHPTGRLV